MIINLMAAQCFPPSRFLLRTIHNVPSLILQAQGTNSDSDAYWLELGKEFPILQLFTPGDPSSQTPEPHASLLGSPVRCAITVAPGGDSDFRRLNKFVDRAWHCVHSSSLHCIDSFSPS